MAWDSKAASAGDKSGGVSGVGSAAAVVPGGGEGISADYVGGGDESGNDQDADDMPATGYGDAAGHADCVPTGAGWPAVQK